MNKTIFLYALLFIFNGLRTFGVEASTYYTFFIITPNEEYITINLIQGNEVKVNEKEYASYSGFIDNGGIIDDMVLVRIEGTKYFCYDSKTQTEHLMFDFSLKKGDTYIDDFRNITYKVTDVRDTIANSKTRKLIELQSIGYDEKHDVWMEDVGSIYTGILSNNEYYKNIYLLSSHHFIINELDLEEFMFSFYPNNQYIKTAVMNKVKQNWEKKIETEEEYKEYIEWCDAPSNLNAEFIGDTLRVWGRLRTSCILQPYAACELKNNQVIFKKYQYKDEPDCYSIYEIETRIPGFRKGKYTIELLNKTIELENTESIYTSVNSTAVFSTSQANTLYDLQGRMIRGQESNSTINSQLSPVNSLKKGIYIQNGKKILKTR